MANYGLSFFLPFIALESMKCMGHEKNEGKKMRIHNLLCGPSKQD